MTMSSLPGGSRRTDHSEDDINNIIRTPEVMAEQFVAVLRAVPTSSVRVDTTTWENCIAVNLEQIRRGDLYVKDNAYLENGKGIRVVSTSQLEAVHSKLSKLLGRMVSIQVGMRILDIFLLKHNLKTAAKYNHNPSFEDFDLMTLCQTMIFCRGVMPDSPQTEFIYKLLCFLPSQATIQQQLRPGSTKPENRPWERLLNLLSISTSAVEATMLRKRAPTADIRLLLSSVHVKQKTISQDNFVDQLGLEPEYEATASFSSNEFSLLEELRSEQLALDENVYWWKKCTAVTTVLYNAAVRQRDNPTLKLKKRSFRTIENTSQR